MVSSDAAQQAVTANVRVGGKSKKAIFRQKKFIIGGVVILLAIAYLVFSAMQGATMYYLTVAELKAKEATLAPAEQVRVGGIVVDGTIQSDQKAMFTRFEIQDKGGSDNLVVEYKGVVPDAFKPGGDAIVTGVYSNGVFKANELLAKCPSKYVPVGN